MNATALAAWGVHFYTASGAVVSLFALDAISGGAYGAAFAWMTLAFILDCTDGTLARRARVKEVLPYFDGAKLDDIVDYLSYVVVPIALARHAELLPAGSAGMMVAACPLLASAYGFCHAQAKTADHFFTGFPSYWNVVVFYLYILSWPVWLNVVTLLGLSVLVFVPIRYLYPSRFPHARSRLIGLGIVWALLIFWILLQFPTPSRWLALVSLFFPAYYIALSVQVHRNTPPSPQMHREAS